MASSLNSRLAWARTVDVAVALLRGTIRVLARMTVVALVVFLIDLQLRLPAWERGLAWVGVLGALGVFIWKFVVQPLQAVRSDDVLALRVESRYPSLAGRLIATVQLTRGMDRWVRRGVARIVDALRSQTEDVAGPFRFSAITPVKPLVKTSGLLGAVALICGTSVLFLPAEWKAFTSRMAFGAGVYPSRYEIIHVSPGSDENPRYVIRGEAQDFSVKFGTRTPASASLELISAGGVVTTCEMRRMGAGVFGYTLAKVIEPFQYRVHGGDAWADTDAAGKRYEVQVRLRPVFETSLLLTYPPYTGETALEVKGGTAKAIEGSRIRVNINISATGESKDIAAAKFIYLSGPNKEVELPMTLTSARTASVDLPKPLYDSFRYTLWVRDVDGVANFDSLQSSDNPPPVYSLRSTPDRRPQVAVTEPSSESFELRDGAQIVVKANAQDDFGVVNLTLHWRLASGVFERQADSDLQGPRWNTESLYRAGATPPSTVLERTFTIGTTAAGAKPGDSIIFFVEAHDHTAAVDEEPLPDASELPRGIGRSREYTLVVVDEETFNRRLHAQLADLTKRFLEERQKYIAVHEKIEPEVQSLLQQRWDLAQDDEAKKDFAGALELYRQIVKIAPDSELGVKAQERIRALETEGVTEEKTDEPRP